jgi:hypothetical protein
MSYQCLGANNDRHRFLLNNLVPRLLIPQIIKLAGKGDIREPLDVDFRNFIFGMKYFSLRHAKERKRRSIGKMENLRIKPLFPPITADNIANCGVCLRSISA